MMKCPQCGEAVASLDLAFDFTEGVVRSGWRKCTLGPIQMTLLEHLMDAYPHGVELADVAAQLYPDEGDSDQCSQRLRANVNILRIKFSQAQMPWEICLLSRGRGADSQIVLMPARALDAARTA